MNIKPITITYDEVVKLKDSGGYALMFSVDLGDVKDSPAKEPFIKAAILELVGKRMSVGGPTHVPAAYDGTVERATMNPEARYLPGAVEWNEKDA